MGVYARYGSINVGAYMAHQPGSHPRGFTDQYDPRWDRGGARGPKTWADPMRWISGWSFGCKTNDAAGSGDMAVICELGHGFEPFSCDGPGNQTKRFIRGVTKDAGGTPISGAIVQGFVTADDRYVGEVQSLDDGTFLLGTETQPGVPHYLVAYKPGSPDIAGTTVNTITSTGVDGT